jgi:hypothetical protein
MAMFGTSLFRTSLCAVSVALLFGGAAAAGTSVTPPLDSVTATLSSVKAGARPVVLTLAVRTELQCGRLVGGALVVHLPAQERMPATVAATAATVGGKPSGAVAVAGHVLTVSIPRPRGMMCDVIGPGTVTLVLTRSANLGNPKTAGTYPLVVSRGAQQFKTTMKISPAG